MRLLIINPNTSKGATDRIREAADAVALPEDRFTTVRPAFGPELIVTQADADQAGRAVVETVRSYADPVDGIVLASFGDTGAEQVRALRPDLPVIGIATAAFSIARSLGGQFGIVTFGQSLIPGLEARVREVGLDHAFLGSAAPDTDDFGDPGTVQSRYVEELRPLCRQMQDRGAASIVLGGGPLAGLARTLAPGCSIPVIDGTQGAINILRTVAAHRGGQIDN